MLRIPLRLIFGLCFAVRQAFLYGLPRRDPQAIFRYWDGTRERGIDPVLAWRGLAEHPRFDPSSTIELAKIGNQQAIDAAIAATRDVFGVTPWKQDAAGHETGLTEQETSSLLSSYFEFLASVKKNTSNSPSSPPLTEPEPLSASSTDPLPTNAGLDSGSTAGESRPNALTES